MKKTYALLFSLLLMTNLTFAYHLILKNGKTFDGTLVSEDAEKVIIKDKDGVVLNFKKAVVDLDQTANANKPEEKAPEPATNEKASEQKTSEAKTEKPKKPARVYTADDLMRLRGEYPMDNTGADIQSPAPDVAPAKGMSGEEWETLTQNLLNQIKQAEQNYQQASAKCKELQGATIQTHMVVNGQNQPVDMVEATKNACAAAEQAKADIDSARKAYDSAVEQARQQNVPPGYIAEDQ